MCNMDTLFVITTNNKNIQRWYRVTLKKNTIPRVKRGRSLWWYGEFELSITTLLWLSSFEYGNTTVLHRGLQMEKSGCMVQCLIEPLRKKIMPKEITTKITKFASDELQEYVWGQKFIFINFTLTETELLWCQTYWDLSQKHTCHR